MGLRYRKSINLGGGFRINLSKSGIGYSYGTKGYRVTKTAKGTTRTTASIPGTGVSYVTETSAKKNIHNSSSNNNSNKSLEAISNTYDTETFENASVSQLHSDSLDELLKLANATMDRYTIACVMFFASLIIGVFWLNLLLIVSLVSLGYLIYIHTKGKIDLEYSIDDEMKMKIAERMKPLIEISKSNAIWRVNQSSKVIDKKYQAGASSVIKREKCTVSKNVPFPFKSNIETITFNLGKETLIFLPDKLFVIQNGKIGALNYDDIKTSVRGQRFIEDQSVPKDAKIVDYTWKYVNKDGSPDKRFKDKNKKIPVCLYGEMTIVSEQGLNTLIMFSNTDIGM